MSDFCTCAKIYYVELINVIIFLDLETFTVAHNHASIISYASSTAELIPLGTRLFVGIGGKRETLPSLLGVYLDPPLLTDSSKLPSLG